MRRAVAAWLGLLTFSCGVSGGQWLVNVTFDAEKAGRAAVVEGTVGATGGAAVLSPWLHEKGDTIEGGKFRLTTDHDRATAKAAGVRVAYHTSLPKGLMVDVEGPAGAALAFDTTLGKAEVPMGQLVRERALDLWGGKARVVLLPGARCLTGGAGSEEFPSVAVLPGGAAAVAYVSWDGRGDSILLRRGDETATVRGPGGDALDPRCAVDGEGRLRVVWSESDGKQWDLFAWSGGAPVRLTRGAENDFWPRVAKDVKGRLWVAWQAVGEDLHYEIRLARLEENGLGPVVNVSESPADDWEPAVCATPDGRLVVAWDTYRNGSFDVYLREFAATGDGAAKPSGEARPVAATAKREAHATVAADSAGRVWVAWDEGIENWGKHPGKGASLHSERGIDLACWSEGALRRPAAALAGALPKAMANCVEYPQIAVDGRDRLWVIFRCQNRVAPIVMKAGARAQSYGMWHEFAVSYDGSAWGAPLLLAHSNGRQDIRADVAADAAGELLVAYAADGRTRAFPYKPVDYDVALASLAGCAGNPGTLSLAAAPDLGTITAASPDAELAPLPRRWTVGGKSYRLVLGDTHRHTDISRCSNGRDGSLQDAYRYALDACGLDWLAISDHDQDILRHREDRVERPRQLYDWWRSQKYCDLYSIPGRFAALYGYEHGGNYKERGGHKNVIHADRGRPVIELDAPEELFAALAGSGALAIPHQLADGGSRADWAKWNAEFERVGEIFQARGSYEFQGCPREAAIHDEGFMMWDALAKGVRIGIIASSDHGQTHEARAGVYVPDEGAAFTRGAILDGLRARRAFGSTTAMAFRASVSGRSIGEEIVADGAPVLDAEIDAPAAVRRIEIVREGKFIYSSEPGRNSARIQFTDVELAEGASAYYYVRALIGEKDIAWTSPVWVTRAARR